MKKALLILALTLAASTVAAQHIPLYTQPDGTAFGIELDRIWSYNLYEHSRWGAGVYYHTEPEGTIFSSTDYSAYVGYGLRDRRLKGGFSWSYMFDFDAFRMGLYSATQLDHFAVGSRQIGSASLTQPGSLAGFMSRRMDRQLRLTLGLQFPLDALDIKFESHMFIGSHLFDGSGLLYECLGDTLFNEDGFDVTLLLQRQAVALRIQAGRSITQGLGFAGILVQYDSTFRFPKLYLGLFAQCGATTLHTPFSYRFNLGGTHGAPLCFSHSLLTVEPDEYTADAFCLASVRLGASKPLYSLWSNLLVLGSMPRPFIGLNGAWGTLWHSDGPWPDSFAAGLQLEAPERGLAEWIVGADGLVRWGMVDYGVALAGRLFPAFASRLTVLLTAELSL